jgi:prophage maintenance system killer protein
MIGLKDNDVGVIIDFLQTRNYDEPIDSLENCNKNKLVSSLKTPFQRTDLDDGREDFIDKSSEIFYLLIENHCLPLNGNKRVATQCLLVLADINGYRINSTDIRLYSMSLVITYLSKHSVAKDEITEDVKDFLRETLEIRVENLIQPSTIKALKRQFKKFLLS